jgi:hypothetical protein
MKTLIMAVLVVALAGCALSPTALFTQQAVYVAPVVAE